jgi:hypothetical protein
MWCISASTSEGARCRQQTVKSAPILRPLTEALDVNQGLPFRHDTKNKKYLNIKNLSNISLAKLAPTPLL